MLYRALKPFEFFEPKTVGEANELLFSYGHRASVLAGGLSLLNAMKKGEKKPEVVVSLNRIEPLSLLEMDRNHDLRIGALATIRGLEKSSEMHKTFPCLARTARCIGSVEVRRMGTVVGNLCEGTPASDMAAIMVALGAKMRIMRPGAERWVPLESFCVGSRQTVLEEGELVQEVVIPAMGDHSFAAYENLARTRPDITKVSVGALVRLENGTAADCRIALGAVAPVILRAKKAEKLLVGQKLTPSVIEEAARIAGDDEAVRPITDIRSTARYRKKMVQVLTERALSDILAQAN